MNFGVYAGSGNRRRWPAPATSTSHWHRILALPALGSVSRSAVVLTNEKNEKKTTPMRIEHETTPGQNNFVRDSFL